LALERHGTLRSASLELGMSQPAATKILAQLEETLGHCLFDRVGRGLKITEAGRCVLGHFGGMAGAATALGRELTQLQQGNAGKLVVGSIMAASPLLLTNAVIKMKREYPLLSVEITENTSDRLIALLDAGVLDLVVGRVSGLSRQKYHFEPIATEPLDLVAANNHPLSNKKVLDFQALLAYPWILQSKGSPMRDVIEHEFSMRHTALPQGLIETSSILTTINLIAVTEYIAVIPHSIALRFQAHRMLHILPYTVTHDLSAFGSVVRADRPLSRTTSRFLNLLHSESRHGE